MHTLEVGSMDGVKGELPKRLLQVYVHKEVNVHLIVLYMMSNTATNQHTSRD